MTDLTHTQQLGAFASSLAVSNLPADVLDRVACCLLYNLALGLEDSQSNDAAQRAIRAVHTAPGRVHVFGSVKQRSAADAAAINAATITRRGQNDTHAAMNGHLGCVVIPVVLALAEEHESTADDVVAAVVAGYEVPPRIANVVAATAMARGWRGTSLFGVFGAAAACSRLLRLDPRQSANALSLAANFAGGLVRCYAEGTPEWAMQVAHAARSGMQAAILAQQGLDAASQVLEGVGGLYAAIGGEPQSLKMTGWRIGEVSFKPFPGCAINQAAVQVLLSMLSAGNLKSHDIEHVVLRLHPAHASYPGIDRNGPFVSQAAAIMSAPFMLQLVLEQGMLRQTDFAERCSADPLHERSRRIRVESDATLAPFECKLELTLRDGGNRVAEAKGTRALVFDWPQTVALTRELAREPAATLSLRRHEELVLAVHRCVHQRDPGAVGALIAAISYERT